jgi:hypothetical protein
MPVHTTRNLLLATANSMRAHTRQKIKGTQLRKCTKKKSADVVKQEERRRRRRRRLGFPRGREEKIRV